MSEYPSKESLEEIKDELSLLYKIVGALMKELGYGIDIKEDKKGQVDSIKLVKEVKYGVRRS